MADRTRPRKIQPAMNNLFHNICFETPGCSAKNNNAQIIKIKLIEIIKACLHNTAVYYIMLSNTACIYNTVP